MKLDDPDVVRREYASEAGLAARTAAYYASAAGPDAREIAFAAVAEAAPRRVLEVGCGFGEFAERVALELGAQVVALDVSPRMVELARGHGVDARLGDVQELPFADGEFFDLAIANWMLYHVPDLERGLAELARVLRPGGRLVATTNGHDHLREIWSMFGDEAAIEISFSRENGEELLSRHFARVERRDVFAGALFRDREAVRAYIRSSITRSHLADRLPEFAGPLRARRSIAVFVAEKAG